MSLAQVVGSSKDRGQSSRQARQGKVAARRADRPVAMFSDTAKISEDAGKDEGAGFDPMIG